MHGILKSAEAAPQRPTLYSQLRRVADAYRHLLLLVVLPTLLTAVYYFGFASDQYETEADYVVRKADNVSGTPSMGELLGMQFGVSSTVPEAHLVSDYLLSHDAVARLRKEDSLVSRFRRPGVDLVSRLWSDNPTPERLLKYYRRQVVIEQDSESGISHLRVHAFTPDDAQSIGRKLLLLGEEQINRLNERTYHDQVVHSEMEMSKASDALSLVEQQLTDFRHRHADIDPEGSGKARIGLVTTLTGDLAAAKASLNAMRGVISQNSPQYRAQAGKVAAMEAQVAGQAQQVAGGDGSIATSLGDYESLVIRRETAARRFATAQAQLEQARAEATRKQIYLVRVVDPNLPVKALYPERAKIVLTVFAGLLLAYAIGWMLIAGMKEHSL